MYTRYTYFRTIISVFGLAYGYNADNYKYIISTTNTCTNSCGANSLSLIQCSSICTQVQGCRGVTLNTNDGNCCVCSSIGVSGLVLTPGKVFYRTASDIICNPDLVIGVPDSGLTATSSSDIHGADHSPRRSRLNTKETSINLAGAWCLATAGPLGNHYIQVRFPYIKEVMGIATQGRNSDRVLIVQYVTSYKVGYSVNCVTFDFIRRADNGIKVFPGNSDKDTIKNNYLPKSVLALCVRIYPLTVEGHPCMRFGVMGCDI